MTKERLRAYRDIKLERDRLEAMVAALEYGPGGLRMDGMPRSGKISDPTGSQAIDHTQVMDLYRQKVAELGAALIEIEQAIECLEPRERTLVRLYYMEGLTWEEVCVEMSYSWRQIHRIHARVLGQLKDL
jgi:RNA polymerase sigma factor (sigma-70 family)